MNPLSWFRKRSAPAKASGLLGGQGKFYYLMSYKEEYADFYEGLEIPDRVLSELFLFRFWLTQCGYRLCKPEELSKDEILKDIIPNGLTLGKGMFEWINSVNLERSLGENIVELMESRFHLYDSAFISGTCASDPLGLKNASVALANQIFESPSPSTITYLTKKAEEQFSNIFSLWSGKGLEDKEAKAPKPIAPAGWKC